MPEKIVGLDISSDTIAAVRVTWGLKGHHVTACDHVAVEEAGGVEEALKTLFERVGLDADVCFSALPGEYVSYRNLVMPFSDRKKIRQTLAYELETLVPFPVEDLIVDFAVIDQSNQSHVFAASLKRTYVSEHLKCLKANGFDPEILDISGMATLSWLLEQPETPENGLLLHIGGTNGMMILYLKRRVVLIRTIPTDGISPGADLDEVEAEHTDGESAPVIESALRLFCRDVQNTLHAFEWHHAKRIRPEKAFVTGSSVVHPELEDSLNRLLGLPVEAVDVSRDSRIHLDDDVARQWNPALMNNALALAVRKTKQDLGFNFRRNEFAVKKEYFGHKKEIRKVAAFLLVILLLFSLDVGVDYHFLNRRYNMLDQQITRIFNETFPDVKRIVDPVQQMKVKIDEIKKTAASLPGTGASGKVLDLLNDISLRLPESADVKVSRMVVDQDSLLIKGETDTFNTVDTIKKGLEPSPYFAAVTISSANLDRSGNRVNFELKLQRAK
jgi:type II secretion system protein L